MYGLGIDLRAPHRIRSDNLGATQLSANSVYHTKIKHVALDFRFVRESVERKTLTVEHISNTLQKAYMLTKALRPARFLKLRSNLFDVYR